ncbi:hypothetical protein [Corynebacterium glaucum]|uniref:hypothetical protein n=1 Tax=Corynebacterium glaucum TaxID=187491 RepID=UPI00265ABF74|nr:hypothetical protein [Corynebacterium glaucum]
MASVFQEAVAHAIAQQPWYIRRQDAIVATAGAVMQLANLVITSSINTPEWICLLAAALIGVCQIAIYAGNQGALTPAQAWRLEHAMGGTSRETPPASGHVVGEGMQVPITDAVVAPPPVSAPAPLPAATSASPPASVLPVSAPPAVPAAAGPDPGAGLPVAHSTMRNTPSI